MKSLFSLLLALPCLTIANTTLNAKLLFKQGSISDYTPTEGRVIDIQTNCHYNQLCSMETPFKTRLHLEYTLKGCMDDLTPLAYHFEARGNNITVFISALNINKPQSQFTKCLIAPTVKKTILLPDNYQAHEIEVIHLTNKL